MIRTIALRVVAVLLSLVLLGWLVADARWRGVGRRLAELDGKALVVVALLFAVSYAMRAARIHDEFRDDVGRRSYLPILRLTLVHNALVNVLPFRSGEAAFPVLLGRWFGVPTGRAVVSLLWLRVQDAAVVLSLVALYGPGLAWPVRGVIVTGIVVAAIAVPWWAQAHRTAAGAQSSGALAARIVELRKLLERATRRSVASWCWTVGNWSVKLVAEAGLVALALGGSVAAGHRLIDTAFLGAVGAELAAILPVQGVAGFGTFEAGGAALMRTQDIDLATGLEVIVVLHAVVLGLAIGAGVLAAALLPRPRRSAAA